jgi:hypothetical protein
VREGLKSIKKSSILSIELNGFPSNGDIFFFSDYVEEESLLFIRSVAERMWTHHQLTSVLFIILGLCGILSCCCCCCCYCCCCYLWYRSDKRARSVPVPDGGESASRSGASQQPRQQEQQQRTPKPKRNNRRSIYATSGYYDVVGDEARKAGTKLANLFRSSGRGEVDAGEDIIALTSIKETGTVPKRQSRPAMLLPRPPTPPRPPTFTTFASPPCNPKLHLSDDYMKPS